MRSFGGQSIANIAELLFKCCVLFGVNGSVEFFNKEKYL